MGDVMTLPTAVVRLHRITREEGDPAKGTWSISWPTGQALVEGWNAALDWLDEFIRNGPLGSETMLLLAGKNATPWVLGDYIEASELVEMGAFESITELWSATAAEIFGNESLYKEILKDPWVTSRMSPLKGGADANTSS